MKTTVKRAIRDEKGKILILVLVLLVVGGLLLTPLLGLMSTGLTAGQVYENKTLQLYAADAGVEDAIWKIQHRDESGLPPICGDAPWNESFKYDIPGLINRSNVHVSIRYLSGGTYRIISTAADGEGRTTVESYVKATLRVKDEGGWYEVLPGGTTYEGGNIEDGARIYVDGDFTMYGDYNIEDPGTVVYVKGDLSMNGTIELGAMVYVEGNLHLGGGIAEDGSKVCVGGNATVPKVEDGAQLYVEENLTVYVNDHPNSGKIEGVDPVEGENTVVCVGGQLIVEDKIEDDPAIHTDNPIIHANGFEPLPFEDCPIECWCCIELEFELVVEILSYQI
ncbi:MAG: hypothetical protein R6V59_03965 [Dehalococcoidia bacterium]